MKVLKNKKSGYTVSLEIEATPDEVEKGLDISFKRQVKHAKVPGFRKGKVPRSIFEKHYGKKALVQEGLTEAINIAYGNAVTELALEVVDYPKNLNMAEYEDEKPVIFTLDVDVKPDVKLGKYKGVKVKKQDTKVDDAKIEDQILQLRENGVEYAEADRGAKTDDILRINVSAQSDGEAIESVTRQNSAHRLGTATFGEDFDKELTGKKATDKHTFSITYEEDFAMKDIANKTVDYEVEVIEVREKKLPELTDELVEKFSEYKTVDEFKTTVKENLEKKLQEEADEQVKLDILEAISAKCTVEVPEGMINTEAGHRVNELQRTLSQSGLSIEQYSAMTGKTVDDLKAEMKEPAEKSVKNELIINAILKEESIEANDEDIAEEVKRLIPTADTDEKVQEELKRVNLDGFKTMIAHRKTIDFLVQHAKIS